MLHRVTLGLVPPKPHTVLRNTAGQLLYEHCLTRRGFDGPYTILYERALPPRDIAHTLADLPPDPPAQCAPILARQHLEGAKLAMDGDFLSARRILLCNQEVALGLVRPTTATPRYFVNGDADELYFVHTGAGTIESNLGPLPYRTGDYLLLPKGIVYRVVPDLSAGPPAFFLIEGKSYIDIPREFRNPSGQLRMDAPYSHRDVRHPIVLPSPSGPDFTPGRYPIVVKRGGVYHQIVRDTDPMGVVGWDGSVYPMALSIHDYQPKVGRVHLPPTIFSTFAGGGFLVCSFVPRLVDFDKNAIPCPYPHSSVDCDEVIFYASGNFTSRRGIGPQSLSFHPAGIPHGPQPGAYEASIGKTRTDELAVMIDTFSPLALTEHGRALLDPRYHDTWSFPPAGTP